MSLLETNQNPLASLDDWEDDIVKRYPEPGTKAKEDYRNYVDSDRVATVKEFYRLNHTYQTYDFVVEKEKEFLTSLRVLTTKRSLGKSCAALARVSLRNR